MHVRNKVGIQKTRGRPIPVADAENLRRDIVNISNIGFCRDSSRDRHRLRAGRQFILIKGFCIRSGLDAADRVIPRHRIGHSPILRGGIAESDSRNIAARHPAGIA